MYHHDHHPTSLGGRCWDTLQAMTAGNAMNACTHPRSLALCSTPYKSEQLHALKSCTLARGDNPDRAQCCCQRRQAQRGAGTHISRTTEAATAALSEHTQCLTVCLCVSVQHSLSCMRVDCTGRCRIMLNSKRLLAAQCFVKLFMNTLV